MRKNLQKIEGKRTTFTGVFKRYGFKSAYKGPSLKTVLLLDITDPVTGQICRDHCWFNYTLGFSALGELREGDVVQFDARVKRYTKGYRGRRFDDMIDNPPSVDYKLSHPTEIKRREPFRVEETALFDLGTRSST